MQIPSERDEPEADHAAQRLLSNIVENIPTAVQLKSVHDDYRAVMWNKAAETMFGIPQHAAIGRNVFDLWPLADAQQMHEADLEVVKNGGVQDFPDRLLPTRGRGYIHVHLRKVALFDANGVASHLLVIADDIGDKRASDIRITRLNRVYAMLSSINALIVRVRDRDELFREACRIAVDAGKFRMAWIGVVDEPNQRIVPIASAGPEPEFLSLTKDRFSLKDDAVGSTLTVLAVKEKRPRVLNDIKADSNLLFAQRRLEQGIHSMAFLPLILADRAVGVLTLYAEDVDFFDADEMKLLGELAGDIAFAMAHLEKIERIDYLALYDVLTGLANRTLFLERVSQYARIATTNGHKMALFLIDIKGFKNINDSLGRAVGDALLRLVGAWLSERVGDANLVARVGADHFAVVLPVVTRNGSVLHLVEQTMDQFLEHPFRLTDAVLRIGAQVGIAVFPGDGDGADTLLMNAEAALKQAKATGERCLFYTDKMTRNVAGKLTLENKLRRALDRNEFVLYYQPKINLASGKLTGAEALIRWNDPATGLVPPAQFIPILEETGLIYEVGRWALHQALADRLCWRSSAFSKLRVAVNVSPRQLRHRSFIADIKRAVSIDPEAASTLELEITESVIMADVKGCIATLNAIRALGVIVAIDDFGTGFSSLSYLAKLPVDILKIDRSFVVEMTTGPQGMALVAAVINVAHALRLNVVAEGVETDEQKRLLQVLNCDEMQGFLFARPMPVSEFEAKFLAL